MNTPEQQEEAIRRRFAKKKELADAYARVFGTDDGDLVLRDLTENSGLFRAGYSDSVTAVSFNEGARASMLYILEKLEESKVDTHQLLRRMMANINAQKQGI